MSTEANPVVSPEDVTAWINEQQPGKVENPPAPEASPAGIPLDVDTETFKASLGGLDAPPPTAPHVSLPEDPVLGHEGDHIWSRQFRGLGKISISDTEKDLYFKAAITGHFVEFDIEMHLEGPTFKETPVIRCRSLNNFEYDAIYRAVIQEQVASAGTLNLEQLNTRTQAYAVIMHITRYQGEPVGQQLSFPGPVFPDLDVAADLLRTYYTKYYRDMHPARYQLLLNAVRVFEKKLIICGEALANRNFYDRAGTN